MGAFGVCCGSSGKEVNHVMTPNQIEAATALGWPAQDEVNIAGWRVLTGLGAVGRVNSCWPLAFTHGNVEAAIDQVEAYYNAKGLPPQFKMIIGGAQPEDMPQRLTARGYRRTSHVGVMTAPIKLLAPEHRATITTCVTPAFASVVTETSPTPLDGKERLEILSRVPKKSSFGSISINGEMVAVGLAAFTGESAGIASMRTKREHRQKGYARSILRAVAAGAMHQGARTLWLQVETDNVPAKHLYESEGFRVAYQYETVRLG